MSTHPLNTVLTAVKFRQHAIQTIRIISPILANLLLDCKGRIFVMVQSSYMYWELCTILGAHQLQALCDLFEYQSCQKSDKVVLTNECYLI